jgi:hypothetical protein
VNHASQDDIADAAGVSDRAMALEDGGLAAGDQRRRELPVSDSSRGKLIEREAVQPRG